MLLPVRFFSIYKAADLGCLLISGSFSFHLQKEITSFTYYHIVCEMDSSETDSSEHNNFDTPGITNENRVILSCNMSFRIIA